MVPTPCIITSGRLNLGRIYHKHKDNYTVAEQKNPVLTTRFKQYKGLYPNITPHIKQQTIFCFGEKENGNGKIPMDPDTGRNYTGDRESNKLYTFDEMLVFLEGVDNKHPDLNVSLLSVLREDSDAVIFDLDDCIENGVLAPWAGEVLAIAKDSCDCEYSFSRSGLHITIGGSKPEWADKFGMKSKTAAGTCDIFFHSQPVAFTGDVYEGIRNFRRNQEAIDKLVRALVIEKTIKPPPRPKKDKQDQDKNGKDGVGFNFEIIDGADLVMNVEPPAQIIEGLLVEGQSAMIGASKKNLKSRTSFDLGLSLATATPALGAFDVPERRRCWIISVEGGSGANKVILDQVASGKNLGPSDYRGWLNVSSKTFRFKVEAHRKALQQQIRNEGTQVLFIDPCYRFAGGIAETDATAMVDYLDDLEQRCREEHCTLVLAHHAKRTTGQTYRGKTYGVVKGVGVLDLDDLRGAGYTEFCRSWILISRTAAYTDKANNEMRLDVGGAGLAGSWLYDVDESRNWQVKIRSTDVKNPNPGDTQTETLYSQMRELCAWLSTKKETRETKSVIETKFGWQGTDTLERVKDISGGLIRHEKGDKELKTGILKNTRYESCYVFDPPETHK